MPSNFAARARARTMLLAADDEELEGLDEVLWDEWESFIDDFGSRVQADELRWAADIREAMLWLRASGEPAPEGSAWAERARTPQEIRSAALANLIPARVVIELADALTEIREMAKDMPEGGEQDGD